MSAHKGKTDRTEDVRELLRKDNYSEVVIDHILEKRKDKIPYKPCE